MRRGKVDTEATRSLLGNRIQEAKLYHSSQEYRELLDFTARLRDMAPFNAMLLHLQKPGLTYAASAADWNEHFRRYPKQSARPLLVMRPFGPLTRKIGRTLDYAREAAAAVGYLPIDSGIVDFLELLDRDHRNRDVYSQTAESAAFQEEDADRRLAKENKFIRQEIIDEIEEFGGVADEEWVDSALRLAATGETIDDAVALAAERLQVKEASDEDATEEDAIPFGEGKPKPERDTGSREPIAPPPSERIPGREEDIGEAPEAVRDDRADKDRQGAEAEVEPGADQKPQTVLPGFEKISNAEMAQRKADQRLKPKKEQKQADEGLFGDDSAGEA